MSGNNIKVVCRFRPQNKRETAEGGVEIVRFDGNGQTVYFEGKEANTNFTFDRSFAPGTSQESVFSYSVKSTVEDVLNGYNGTVFAYGQTGSGKTYTMMGADIDSTAEKGIIPRITEQIFTSIMQAPPHLEFTVKVSYMEIYMEKVRDLLNPANDNLPVHEEKNRGVYVKGLLEVYVSSVPEVYEVMRRGGSARIVAYTNMNAESSRSHSIFIMTVSQKNTTDGSVKSGKLYLVDLAGSEKVGKTGASGQTLEEAKKINKSLTALGMVINSLTDGKSTHVPYRDSKLTRILQESLGGNSRTTLIINSSPSSFNESESLSTMRFGMRAKSIKNRAKVNQDLSPAELQALLRKAEQKAISFKNYIGLLEGEINLWRAGSPVPKEKQVPLGGSNDDIPSAKEMSTSNSTQLNSSMGSNMNLNSDEKDELLRRENELMDELTTKETDLERLKALNMTLEQELAILKEREATLFDENKELSNAVTEVKLNLERVNHESKEAYINLDDLKEQNRLLTEQIDSLKKMIMELEESKRGDGNKERVRQERVTKMMAELDTSSAIFEKEKAVRTSLEHLLTAIGDPNSTGSVIHDSLEMLPAAERDAIVKEISAAKAVVEEMEDKLRVTNVENKLLVQRKDELENRIRTLELEYEQLLNKTIADEEKRLTGNADTASDLNEMKKIMEAQAEFKVKDKDKLLEDTKLQLAAKQEEINALQYTKNELQKMVETLAEQSTKKSSKPVAAGDDLDKIKKVMGQQLAEFDAMKKHLMKDLQDRCEKVVELELALDEAREQYNNVLKNNDVKANQKKMAFLERNLEQLTSVQRQLVEQNATLKKDIAIAERKLSARNERIDHLEAMLSEAQTKLTVQKQGFDSQLADLKQKFRDVPQTGNPPMDWSFGRVAKPLRGGGGNNSTKSPSIAVNTAVATNGEAPNSAKSAGWFGYLGM